MPLSQHDQMALLELFKADMSIRAVASATGLSPTTVQKYFAEWTTEGDEVFWKRSMGTDGKLRPSRRFDTSERDAEIVKMYAGFYTVAEIAAEVGCSVGTVHRIIVRDSPRWARKQARKLNLGDL